MRSLLLSFLLFYTISLLVNCSSDEITAPEPPPKKEISKIYFDSAEKAMKIGENLQLSAAHTPTELAAPNYIWQSSSPEVATVSGGYVHALKQGETTIKVKVAEKEIYAEIKIIVSNIEVAKVEMDVTEKTLEVDQTFKFSAIISPATSTVKDLKWSSSNNSVVTVDQYGSIKAIAKGTAEIIAEANNGVKGLAKITVIGKQIKAIILDKTSYDLLAGDSHQINYSITPLDAENKDLTWTSSNPAQVTVSSNGLIKAVGSNGGNATITVETKDASNLLKNINVNIRDITSFISTRMSVTGTLTFRTEGVTGSFNLVFENNSTKSVILDGVQVIDGNSFLLIHQKVGTTVLSGQEYRYPVTLNNAKQKITVIAYYTYQGVQYQKSFTI